MGKGVLAPIIIGFAGPIASGKSTIIREITQIKPCLVASYGNYVRAVAETQGIEGSRDALQALSNELLRQYTHVELAKLVTEHSGWKINQPLLLDGVRHSEAIGAFKALFPTIPVYLIFVETPVSVRSNRIERRDGISLNDAAIHDKHNTEIEANTGLKDIADYVLDGTDLAGALSLMLELLCKGYPNTQRGFP